MRKNQGICTIATVIVVSFGCLFSQIEQAEGQQTEEVKLTASFQIDKGKRTGMLFVQAIAAEECYIYSLTQKKVPPPSKIKFDESDEIEIGEFMSNQKPKVVYDDLFKNDMEKHYGVTVFQAPIKFADEVDIEKFEMKVKFTGQVCNDEKETCTPIRGLELTAKYGGVLKVVKKEEKSDSKASQEKKSEKKKSDDDSKGKLEKKTGNDKATAAGSINKK